MITEKATVSWDLPHTYVEVSARTLTCQCGRFAEDQLHQPTPEVASAGYAFVVTEKGV